jgi:hypothetical protein
MAVNNKPFFTPQQDVNLFDAINEELIDELIGQSVDVYKISVEDTNSNIYGESSTKYYNDGFRVNCLIQYNDPETLQEEFGADVNATIELYFHRTTLSEAGFYPEVGDIVDWNDIYWEMGSVTEPQLISGHQNFKHQIKVNAHRMRLSNLQIEERAK